MMFDKDGECDKSFLHDILEEHWNFSLSKLNHHYLYMIIICEKVIKILL